MRTLHELVHIVREHAEKNYNFDGWDYVVECWSDEEIEEVILCARTAQEAIKLVHDEVKHVDAYRKDVQGA